MKQKLPVFATSLVLAALLWTACNKPSPFGSELLEEELADIEFTDTLSVLFTVQREDSLLTSDPSSTSAAFLCGTLDDPHFGKSEAEIFSLLQKSIICRSLGWFVVATTISPTLFARLRRSI